MITRKNFIRIASFVVCFIATTVLCLAKPVSSNAVVYSVPNYVRVGLKYGSTAVSSVTTSSATGGTIGAYANGTYYSLSSFASYNTVTFEKDSYYHLQIGPSFSSANEMISYMEILKSRMTSANNSINLYSYYDGDFSVCASFYSVYPQAGGNNSIDGIDEYTALNNIFNPQKTNSMAPLTVVSLSSIDANGALNVAPVEKNNNGVYAKVGILPSLLTVFAFSPPASGYSEVRVVPNNVSEGATEPPLLNYVKARYRGSLTIHRISEGNLILINELPMEEYLYSVVPAELGAGDASKYNDRIEALKVQAISARTSASNYIRTGGYGNYKFDVVDTVANQVYKGYTSSTGAVAEYYNSTCAVDFTKGQVLMYNGKLATQIYYHSDSGGYTESTTNVWGGTPEAYIVSKPDPYTAEVNKTWNKTYTGKELSTTFRNYIAALNSTDVGTVKYVNVVKRSTSGRVTALLVEGTTANYTLTLEKTRSVLSLSSSSMMYNFAVTDNLTIVSQSNSSSTQLSQRAKKVLEGGFYSTQFVNDQYAVKNNNDGFYYERIKVYDSTNQNITVNGHGTGHGIGMSQDGVIVMSSSKYGFKMEEILQFYFPGIVISEKQ